MASMPRYSGRDVSVRLSVANLAASTPLPATKPSNQVKNLATSAAALNVGILQGVLAEGCLTNGEYDRDLVWLGDHQETPFQMRVIGNDLYQNAPEALGTTKAGRVANLSDHTAKPSDKATYAAPEPRKAGVPKEPLALCLTVFLSEHCFRTPNNYGRPHDKDVNIVVFFNGELSNSEHVPYRFGNETYKYTQHVVRFSGRRIGKHLEKPWVVVPPKANGETPLEDMQILDAKIASTWDAVNAALIKVAENNCKNESDKENYTHLGNYLKSLADVPMPQNLMTTEDGKRCDRTRPFSVIDVVILAGKGGKDSSSEGEEIDKPTLLRSSRIKATEPAPEAPRDPGGAVSSLKPSPTTPVARLAGAAEQVDTTGHTEVGVPSSEGYPVESPYVSSQGHITDLPYATTQGHNVGYSYASGGDGAVGQPTASAQRQSLESPYAAAQGHSVDFLLSISEDHTVESLSATPQNQITLSTETTQSSDTPSEQAAITTSGNTASTADNNTTTNLPRPAKKRRFVPEDEKAAASHREKVRRRFTVPEDFIPESVPGFDTRQQRTRSGHLNPPAPAPAAAAAPIPTAPKPKRKRAPKPPGFTRAINTDQPVEEQIKDLEMQISEAALQDLNDPTPHTDAEDDSDSDNDTAARDPGFTTPFFSNSSALSTKRRRAVKKSSSSVFMSGSEIARQEAGFVPVITGSEADLGVTYAKKGVVRQAKMERGGWFEEEKVVFGVRILC